MNSSTSTFRHYPQRPERLTPEFIEQEHQTLQEKIKLADASPTSDLWIRLFQNWNELKSYAGSETSRIRYRYSGNLLNKDYESADTYVREKVVPALDKGTGLIMEAVMKSKHRGALVETFGEQIFNVFDTQIKPLDPRLADLRMDESRLSNEYRKLVGTAEVEFRGEKLTLPKVSTFLTYPEGETRRESFLTSRKWFEANAKTIARIFDDLVKVRQAMAEKLGNQNFLDLGYLRMGRTDYGATEAAAFRKSIRDFVVPLQTRMHAEQAKALGEKTLRPWNASYFPKLVLPMKIAPVESQLERAQKVFDRMSPELSARFSMMRKEKLIDLENRPGKAAGAFCTAFPDEQRVAIFCNSTGNASDVSTLMHEMGHAFQMLGSMQDDRPDELIVPTYDAAEVHSMGMEYLSLSRLDEFFSTEEREKFRQGRWKSAIELFCYVAIVDEFQHWVYENPKASIAERDDKWVELVKIYQPSLDFSGYENLMPMRWYAQGHIFAMPFYYIDYAIAETGAMQLAILDSEDPKRAIEVYLELCRIGGGKSVLKIFSGAGLESPFSADIMKHLMQYAEKQVGLS